MIKSIFLDYTGTILQLKGPEYDQLINTAIDNSSLKTKEEAEHWFFEHLRAIEKECYRDTFLTEKELFMKLLNMADTELKLKENHTVMRTLVQNYWMYAPIYSDVANFMNKVGLPIYIIMDNSSDYAKVCLRRNGLHANAIISGEDVKSYKPRKEVFERALELSGCDASEVIHVGDDLEGDVQGARNAGITPILLDRKSMHRDVDCKRIRSLSELIPYIKRENEK